MHAVRGWGGQPDDRRAHDRGVDRPQAFGPVLGRQHAGLSDAAGHQYVHVHDGEDEMFYVLSGDLTGHCGDQRWSASPGAFVLLPRDIEHSFTVTSRSEAKVLIVVGPPRFDAHVAQRGIPAS
jgi:mannose-6-phosphate isomerase-like protein (cupin superfamily)